MTRASARRPPPLPTGGDGNSIYNYDKPTIAMVHGYCVGGAFMQLLACDFAIAAENATFSLSEVNWGILPGALVSKAVADMVLPRHAGYYACLGDPFDGKEAARIGMINYAVPPDQLEHADHRPRRTAHEEEPSRVAGDQASHPPCPDHGCAAGLRTTWPPRDRPSRSPTRRIPTTPACANSSMRKPTSRRSSRSSSERMLTDQQRELVAEEMSRNVLGRKGGDSHDTKNADCRRSRRALPRRRRVGTASAQFYRGKSVTMVINYPAGGPSDIEGRIIAQHLPAHIPGKPP